MRLRTGGARRRCRRWENTDRTERYCPGGPEALEGTIVTQRSPTPHVPWFGLPPNDYENDSAAIAGMLHDVIAQALFRADLALSDLSDRIPPGSLERELADEALDSVLAALRDVRRAIGELQAGAPLDVG